MPPLTLALILANVLVHALPVLTGHPLDLRLALWPAGAGFHAWQPATYAFVHGNAWHLALNMVGLWSFGADLERHLGARRFSLLYAASVLAGAAVQLVASAALHVVQPTGGASGGVFGLVIAFALLFPRDEVISLVPPIPVPIPVWLWVALFVLAEIAIWIFGLMPGVAHFVHLGGAIGGGLAALRWRGLPAPGAPPR